ncbi:hypothetical protein [Marinomonas sp. FW-1]|uniref:hypothetical protein n=1 Tax=Marinomonas sp. FW-1 TaxID=2071621 RepID=UPI0010BF754B|nr:hypothetical protein [Marinomonas sp. FW-1]
MGLFSTVVKAATTVASKVLTEVLNPVISQESSKAQSIEGAFKPIYKMGAVQWGLRNSVPYVLNILPDRNPVGITFNKTYIGKDGSNQSKSSYLLLDFDTDAYDVSELLSEFNDLNCSITVSPVDSEVSSNITGFFNSQSQPLKKITTSISQINLNNSFKIGTNAICTFTKKDDLYGIRITSPVPAENYIVNAQAIFESDVVFATYNSNEHQVDHSSSTNIFIPFPEGTNFPNDIANSVFVELILNSSAHESIIKGCLRGVSLKI